MQLQLLRLKLEEIGIYEVSLSSELAAEVNTAPTLWHAMVSSVQPQPEDMVALGTDGFESTLQIKLYACTLVLADESQHILKNCL